MTPLQTELHRLRWPLLRLAIALLIAVALSLTARHYMHQANAATAAAELNAMQSRTRTQQLQNEEQDTRAKITEYQALIARGIIGPEKRLDWVELLRNTQRERQLLGLEYEILPQVPWSTPNITGGNTGYSFMNSTVRVQLPLLHEDDLLHFMQDMRKNAPAYARLRSCKVQRAPQAPFDAVELMPQLNADCLMDWITLQNPTEKRP